MNKVKWGIIGPGKIANNFADGLKEAQSGELVAIASKTDYRRKSFGDKYNIDNSLRFKSYEEIIQSPNVDAIYISTPHTFHSEWTIRAANKGKHVLCEKPSSVNYFQGKKVIDTIKNAKVFFMEGFMYRCHPQIIKLLNIIESNVIGKIIMIQSSFGFKADKENLKSRLFNINLAGGAILDVGLYPISFSRLIAGAVSGIPFMNPTTIEGNAKIGSTGVDETAHAILYFDNNIIAKASASICYKMNNNAIIKGTKGSIILNNPWQPGKDGGPYNSSIIIDAQGKQKIVKLSGPEHLFFFEAEVASKSIIEKKTEPSFPAMTWNDTLGNLEVLDKWRKAIGYKLPQDIS